nr:MAG TPA: hypothetical protein [Caudoviricetes sp.]
MNWGQIFEIAKTEVVSNHLQKGIRYLRSFKRI